MAGIETRLPLGEDLDASLAAAEARFGDMRPGHEKEIIWANKSKKKTKIAVIYVHGFSASKGEIRPVPDLVAKSLKANLFYTRLPGHGRNSRAMAETVKSEWMDCLDEAYEVGRRIGEQIVFISCSTGGTLLSAGFLDPARRQDVLANIFVAPNFQVNSKLANIAYLPGAAHWMEKVAGDEYSFEPRNEQHAKWWTTTYPPSSIVPMMELVRDARRGDLSKIDIPTLAIYSAYDQVVVAKATDKTLARWGGPVTVERPPNGAGTDELEHVVLGEIVSPANTEWGVQTMLSWLKEFLP